MYNNINYTSESSIIQLINNIKSKLGISENTNVDFYTPSILKSELGAHSGAIYILEYENTKLILKTGLDDISRITETSKFIRENHPELESKGNLILPILVGEFNGGFYELLPLARGSSFSKLWSQYFNNEISAENLEKCYFNLGQTLSDIHLTGKVNNSLDLSRLKTYLTHLELHTSNMFCDNYAAVTLIDNGWFSNNIKNSTNVEKDLFGVFDNNIKLDLLFSNKQQITEAMRKEHIEIISSFLKGYSSNLQGMDFDEYLTCIFVDRVNDIYSLFPDILLSGSEKYDMIFNILGEAFPDREFADDLI